MKLADYSNLSNLNQLFLKLGLGLAVIFLSLFCALEAKALTTNPRIEISGDPGARATTTIKVTNEVRESRTYYLRAENFNSQDETGVPSFNLRREGLSTWIDVPSTITLGPGETIELPIGINIPANAEPGGHYAAVFFLTDPPAADSAGVVALSSKLGTLILLRVNGEFVQDADILEFGTLNYQKFYSQLPVQFQYRFQSTGDDHVKPVGDITISNIFGQTAKILVANTVEGSVLPKSVRKFYSVWLHKSGDLRQEPIVDLPKSEPMGYWDSVRYQFKNFAMGSYTANLELAFGTKELKSDRAEFTFYIIPWQLLSVVVPGLIILLVVLRWAVKRYNKYIIAKAQSNASN